MKLSYARLQRSFSCTKCGECCLLGGDIYLDHDEVDRISKYLYPGLRDELPIHIMRSADYPELFQFTSCRPCPFYDESTRLCSIYEVRPKACRDYPWLYYQQFGCTLGAVAICPPACDQFDKLFKSNARW